MVCLIQMTWYQTLWHELVLFGIQKGPLGSHFCVPKKQFCVYGKQFCVPEEQLFVPANQFCLSRKWLNVSEGANLCASGAMRCAWEATQHARGANLCAWEPFIYVWETILFIHCETSWLPLGIPGGSPWVPSFFVPKEQLCVRLGDALVSFVLIYWA